MSSTREKLSAWLALSRLPFHTVGLLPFFLGGVLSWHEGQAIDWAIFVWGALGVALVMLATYYAGEYWDYVEDTHSARLGGSRFSGGSGVLQRGLLPRRAALWASLTSLVLALGTALVLWLAHDTGPWTLPFMILGLLGGFFYSTRPIRWVRTGVGEVWIAFCYGWLPVAVGYYLQRGCVTSIVHWMAIPMGLSIFNVILLNEFPDYPADAVAGKRNLAVRLGRQRACIIYALAGVGGWIGMALSVRYGVPRQALYFCAPVLVLSVILIILVLRGRWREREVLERLCGANLLVNLGTTASYMAAFLV